MEDDNDNWSVVLPRGRAIKDQKKSELADKSLNTEHPTKTITRSKIRLGGQSTTLQESDGSKRREDLDSLIGCFVYQGRPTAQPTSTSTSATADGSHTRRSLNSIVEEATPTSTDYKGQEHVTETYKWRDGQNATTSHSDLIGAPIVIPAHHGYHGEPHPTSTSQEAENVKDFPGVGVAKRERGLIRLRPGMLGPTVSGTFVYCITTL